MKTINPMIRPLADNEITIEMRPCEVKRVFEFLGEKLKGKIRDTVVLDTNNYRSFFSCFTGREYRYVLTWNEALRLHSYLRYYIERNKNKKLAVTMAQIRHFPLYGINTSKEF